MLAARKGLDVHDAYSQFRSFAEIFNMRELDPGLETTSGGDGVSGSDVGKQPIIRKSWKKSEQPMQQQKQELEAAHASNKARAGSRASSPCNNKSNSWRQHMQQ